MKKRMAKLFIMGFICLLGLSLFLLYQNGFIGSHTFSELFSKSIHNPYNGAYYFNLDKIQNEKLMQNVKIAKERNDVLELKIDNSGASLLGYQHDTRVRNRFFTVCLGEGTLTLNSGMLGSYKSDYCKTPSDSRYQLKLRAISNDTLFCENCLEHEYPSYWVKKL